MRIKLSPEDAGLRLDKVVCERIPGLGRATVKRLFAEGKVQVVSPSGKLRRAVKGDVAAEGAEVEVEVPSTDTTAVPDPDTPLTVVLETDLVLLLDKPAGQPTAPLAPGEKGALANALVARYPELASIGFSPREPGLCHRLDTDTSGLVLAARTKEAFVTLTTALREGRLDKRYLLLVQAADLPSVGTIDIGLAPHPKDKRRVLACVHPRDVARNDPRPAVTTYQVLSERDGVALVEARAPRAMRHQIRAHFAAIDHPLLGDSLYGGPVVPGLTRHALHAHYVAWGGDAVVPALAVRLELPPELAAFVAQEEA